MAVAAVLGWAAGARAATMPAYDRLPPLGVPLIAPTAVALDAAERVYVVESSENALLVYDAGGLYLRARRELHKPISVAADDTGRVLVGNSGAGNVAVFHADLTPAFTLGTGDGEFGKPAGIAVDAAGNIYVADGGRDRVAVYDADGVYRFAFGGPGTSDGMFNFPTAIAIDRAAGEIVVTDLHIVQSATESFEGARVQIFDMRGSFKRGFGTFGQGAGKLTRPMGVAVDAARRIYVADAVQNVVEVFDGDTGDFLGAVGDIANQFRTPLGLAIGPSNRLFIASLNTGTVEVYGLVPYMLPTSTPTETPTHSPTATATATRLPTRTPTVAPTDTATQTPTLTATPTRTPTLRPSPTPTPTPTPSPVCGNGVLEPGEQCDDGNPTDGDSCSAACAYELIPGNSAGTDTTDKRACVIEWAVANPHNLPATDARGRPYSIQTCQDNDPTCDFDLDPATNTCEFHVVACLNNVDPHLPACTPRGVADSIRVLLPSPRLDRGNYTALTTALQNLRNPATGATGLKPPVAAADTNLCTAPFAIRVPLREATPFSTGRVYLRTLSRSLVGASLPVADLDMLTLVCRP